MTEQQFNEALANAPRGANVKAVWERPVKVRVAYKGIPLTKRTQAVIRIGVDYDHKDIVQKGREDGTLPAENAGLRGMEWEQFPILLRSIKTGKLMLRVERGTNADCKAKVQYKLDGQDQTLEQVKHMMLGSELPNDRPKSATFNVPVTAIEQLHHYIVEDEDEDEAVTA